MEYSIRLARSGIKDISVSFVWFTMELTPDEIGYGHRMLGKYKNRRAGTEFVSSLGPMNTLAVITSCWKKVRKKYLGIDSRSSCMIRAVLVEARPKSCSVLKKVRGCPQSLQCQIQGA
jgi:hypothetical protein